jgi:hypothetical protein
MTRKVLALVLLILSGFVFPAFLSADVLLIEEVRQVENMNVPPNGMVKADVRAQFGDPAKINAAVGDPPIARWDYGQWSVYFEYDIVLFTVIHKDAMPKKKTE